MIESLSIKNFGQIRDFRAEQFGLLNLVIGPNGTGKTFLLKALYSAIRTLEDFGKGDDDRTFSDILAEQLRWCFQAEKIGELVTKGADEALQFCMVDDKETLSYSFSGGAEKKAGNIKNDHRKREINSIFLPAKEVLSLFDIIREFATVRRKFGFDSTYLDLVNALSIAPHRGKNFSAFSKARSSLENMLGGKADFNQSTNRWYYKEGKIKYSIGIASEGVKKISILDRLLANDYLSKGSIIFIDEIESALHPQAITALMDIIADLSEKMQIQFFISTHSYHVVKKMYLLALKSRKFTPCISFRKNASAQISNLAEDFPENPIIDEAIRLYEEELAVQL